MIVRSTATRLPFRLVLPLAPPRHRRRPFFTLPTAVAAAANTTQTLAATRTLPYAPEDLFQLVADVDSYSQFVPYCAKSRVTQWSAVPDAAGRRWPILADLHVGWAGLNEHFTSRLRCVPDVLVEATSGGGGGHPDGGSLPAPAHASNASAVFKTLVTRWSLRPLLPTPSSSHPSTEVSLSIKFQFTSPLYATVSAAVSDKIAPLMIEAFEKRARQLLGPPS